MTDETKPKRIRGLKLLEQGYREGFTAGVIFAYEEEDSRHTLLAKREGAVDAGVSKLLANAQGAPKRTRRKREEKRGNEANSHAESSGPID